MTDSTTNPPFKIFNLDLHVSVIEDFKSICAKLYGPRVEITNWSISGHNWVFNKPNANTKVITSETWLKINQEMVDTFQAEYDELLKTYDAFVVTHTPVFALLFEKYQKPIVIINSCRYDMPFCWTHNQEHKEWLNTALVRMVQSKQCVIVSNNAADQAYIMSSISVQSHVIPSLCLYTNITHKPQQYTFMCYGNRSIFPEHELLIKRPDNFTWPSLFSHRGIVHTPYEMSTMSIFEQFWAGVPLFFPTKRYYVECVINETMDFVSIYSKHEDGMFSQEDMIPWLELADFYRFPFIHYYDSAEDLIQQLETFEDTTYTERMEWIQQTKKQVLDTWAELLSDHFHLSTPTP
jgi:hypothetical protein